MSGAGGGISAWGWAGVPEPMLCVGPSSTPLGGGAPPARGRCVGVKSPCSGGGWGTGTGCPAPGLSRMEETRSIPPVSRMPAGIQLWKPAVPSA